MGGGSEVGGVLDRIRVFDLSRYLAGPLDCMLLADIGARVIRAEKLGGDKDKQIGAFASNG